LLAAKRQIWTTTTMETEARLKVKADARDVKTAGAAIKEAFSPKQLRDFRLAARDVEHQLRSVTQEQVKLSRALEGTQRGTDAYKKLKDELKEVRQHASELQSTLTNVNRQLQVGTQRRQGFMAGVAQGTGLAQYMPTGPGMMARMAGAGLGGMGRRAAGAAAAPFLMPGMQGMSALIGSIPLIGGAAAGALQAGAGMFQEAVGFHRARQQNLFGAGGVGVFEAGARVQRMARRRAFARTQAAADDQAGRQQGASAALLARANQLALPEVFGAPSGEALGLELTGIKQAQGTGRPGPTWMRPFMAPTAAQASQERGGGALRASLQAASARADAAQQARMARIKAMRANIPVALPGAGFGVEFGVGPQQMMQQFGQFMQARGGVYTAGARGQFREGLAAQAAFGISAAQSGAYARAGLAGGGATAGGMGLSGVLASAVAQGMRGSRVAEYLQQLVTLSQQAERMGIKINMADMTRQSAMLTAQGIAGPQAARIAGGLNQAAMNVSQQGVQTPAQVAMLRAAGWKPEQGRLGYVRAMQRLEGGMSPEILNNVLSMSRNELGAQFKGEGASDLRAFGLKRFLSRGLGTNISFAQARTLLEAPQGEAWSRYQGMVSAGESPNARSRLIAGAAARVGAGAGLSISSASLEAQRISAGAKLSDVFISLEKTGIGTVRVLGQFRGGLLKVTKAMESTVGALEKLSEGNVIANILAMMGGSSILSTLTGGASKTVGNIAKAVGQKR
jgi:exonuclease VII small subunit